jgi:hypothetical protein
MQILHKLFAGGAIAAFLLMAGAGRAQTSTGALRGQIADESGALIPDAAITLTGTAGEVQSVKSGPDGAFNVTGLAPGSYTVRVVVTGFAVFEKKGIRIAADRTQTLNIPLRISLGKQEVTVEDQPGTTVSTDPSNNAGALVLRGEDLEALPDDPDDLESDLQALAGPSAGPNGGQIYIDGFSGGRLPPKSSIREIRINQNPFSAEYDHLGFGRIEILTKPGTDKFHGQTFFNFGDESLNARNPYASNKPPFQMRTFGGNVSGPISKRASFFVDLERREIDDNAVINATILDPDLNIVPFSEAIVTPQRRTSISPRLDYQLNKNNTLTGRYTYRHVGHENSGIGEFSLASRAYDTLETGQTVQLTETAVLNARAVNETRFQYIRERTNQIADNSIPALNVLDAFTGGGSQIGRAFNTEQRWELHNYTSLTRGTHVLRFGTRLRSVSLSDYSPNNFGGTYTFSGGLAPVLDSSGQVVTGSDGQPELARITSIERYRRTLLFEQQGLTIDEIRRLGGGASQYTIAAGIPEADIRQTDVGLFLQDDWRLKPNLTLSLGLRYETQTNIHDWHDFAPRIGIAWAPGARANRPGKTVIRGGFGMFYDRFSENLVLQSERFNGVTQRQFIVNNPDFFPNAPPIETLQLQPVSESIRRIDQTLRAPYIIQSAIGVERQLPRNTTAALTFTNSRGVHMLRARDINAPIPDLGGVRPYGADAGNLFDYESTGIFNQNQMIANLNSRLNRSVTLFTFYVLNHAMSDTDGASSSPANPYDLTREYGRSSMDVRHRFVVGGSIATKWSIRFSPFIIARSGSPFNITTGRDSNGDTVFVDRPAIATDLTNPDTVMTPFGAFNPNPLPGQVLIARNYGQGPGFFSVNLRMGKVFGFGPHRETAASSTGGRGGGGGGGGGDHGGGRGGMRMGGGGGGFHGIFSDGSTDRRYNLSVAVSARNLLNTTNEGAFTGNLTSPFFGRANSLAGSFGPAAAAGNRRIELQMRFTF